MIPSERWVAKCCHPGTDGGGPLAVRDNRRKRISLEEGDVVDGGGVSGGEEEVGVPFDEGVHLQ